MHGSDERRYADGALVHEHLRAGGIDQHGQRRDLRGELTELADHSGVRVSRDGAAALTQVALEVVVSAGGVTECQAYDAQIVQQTKARHELIGTLELAQGRLVIARVVELQRALTALFGLRLARAIRGRGCERRRRSGGCRAARRRVFWRRPNAKHKQRRGHEQRCASQRALRYQGLVLSIGGRPGRFTELAAASAVVAVAGTGAGASTVAPELWSCACLSALGVAPWLASNDRAGVVARVACICGLSTRGWLEPADIGPGRAVSVLAVGAGASGVSIVAAAATVGRAGFKSGTTADPCSARCL